MRPPDLPTASVLAERHPHGVRVRYTAGCRCEPCRTANRDYERRRKKARIFHGPNALVPSDRVRKHIKALSRKNVGYKQVAATANVSKSILAEILYCDRKFVRAHTERKVLAVTASAIADGALVPAGPSWEKINRLVSSGFSKSEIARRLNYKNGAIQLRKTFITARNASQVDRLYTIIRNKGVALLGHGVPLQRQARA
jgi:hypothetical protein